eukprot:scaffold14867_cov29-Tisochrysis_lutea.AAC.3
MELTHGAVNIFVVRTLPTPSLARSSARRSHGECNATFPQIGSRTHKSARSAHRSLTRAREMGRNARRPWARKRKVRAPLCARAKVKGSKVAQWCEWCVPRC